MAVDDDPGLIQYRVFADHRLHYGRLFFQVIAFNIACTLAIALVGVQLPSIWWPALAIVGGGMFLGTAYIAYRLNRQEAAYAHLLTAIEQGRSGWLSSPAPGGVSSRHLTPVGLAIVGLVVALLSLAL